MRITAIIFLLLISAFLGTINYHLVNRLSLLEMIVEGQTLAINAVNESAEAREDKLQDTLEDRIGKLEGDLDSIKFMVGVKEFD